MQEFIIRPNRSLSRRGLIILILTLSLVLGFSALRLAYMGLWLVIPFLLVDLLAVAAAFYWIYRKCSIYESIRIDAAMLCIKHHQARHSKSWRFDLNWVMVKLQTHDHPWQPSRLLLGSHGKWIEFGEFLTNEERVSLSRALTQSIHEQRHHG